MTESESMGKLRWQCRRGMKELDIFFEHYLDHHYLEAPEQEQQAFRALIETQDPIIMDYFTGKATPPTQAEIDVLTLMQKR